MNIVIKQVDKIFSLLRGTHKAVDNLSMEIFDKEFFVLLGPSGCGKSTTLNLIAGLEKPSAGEICFGERVVASADKKIFSSPKDRNVAMVFQNYALYPHLDVFENIAFPLRILKEKKDTVADRVQTAAKILHLSHLLRNKPQQLSGGERQRVAIARAIVREPSVFLLDEPLSNLDAQLRASTRAELKQLQRRLAKTTLYVTHDQVEAMTMGDRIALLNKGKIEQVGTPDELYNQPANRFVAAFIGSPPINFLDVVIESKNSVPVANINGLQILIDKKKIPSGINRCTLGIRPEHVKINIGDSDSFKMKITTIEYLGKEVILHLRRDEISLTAISDAHDFNENDEVDVCLMNDKIHLFAH